MSRKDIRRLKCIEDRVRASEQGIENYIKKSKEIFIAAINNNTGNIEKI